MSYFDMYFVWALYGKKTSHSLLPFHSHTMLNQ